MPWCHLWDRPYSLQVGLFPCYTVPVTNPPHLVMALSFDRIQAGEYQINDGPKMVGYVRKQNASKWIMYKCSNPSMLGNPIAVQKTLKALKVEAETLIGSTYVAPVKAAPAPKSTAKMTAKMDPEKYEMMKEMMERDYVIDLKEYEQTENGLEEVSPTVAELSAQEDWIAF